MNQRVDRVDGGLKELKGLNEETALGNLFAA